MQLNAYTAFSRLLLLVLLSLVTLPIGFGQTSDDIFDLRIHTEVNCSDNVLTAALQIKSQQDSFRIGTSSILFKYDENVLEFLDYFSENFDENDKVDFFGTQASVWAAHKFNSSFAGTCNLTLLSEIAAASFPNVETEWLTIGVARFNVKNMNASPNFTFDVGNTNFNRHSPNDGTHAPTKGAFDATNGLLLILNDIVSNPTFSIVTNPNSGTASINPNGTLQYSSNAPYCGQDELTYKVCNDGDDSCCAEAKVTIQFKDELPPIFMNAPNDMTVSCGNVPEMENVQASDNCFLAGMDQKEVIENGNCGSSKVYIRTWTAFDLCDNLATHIQRITVEDNDAPTISCSAELLLNCSSISGNIIETDQPIISDNCASLEEMTIAFVDEDISEVCENNVQRQFNRTWTATDLCGNFATCTQLIKIIDDLAPAIVCPADITVNCGQNITPESLELTATAFDSCSNTTLSYVDEGTVPSDCGAEDVSINRIWTATDACGNSSSCTQKITFKGEPCPQTIERQTTVYQCENDIVNLAALADISENADVTFSIRNTQELVINTTQYLLPSTGCEIGNFEFSYKIYDERQCLIENSVLIIKTIPRIIADTRLSDDSCTAELVLECPDLYEVNWATTSATGIGNKFDANGGESGSVVFTLNFKGLELPSDLELPCLSQQYEVTYSCPMPCPLGIQEELTIIGCQGDFVNLRNRLQVGELDRVESSETIEELAEYQLVGDSLSCGITEKELLFNIFDENDCLIRSVQLLVKVVHPVQGEIIHENDFCKARLEFSCPNFYQVTWKDNFGNEGVGPLYEGTEGTSGFVTFYTTPINELYKSELCAIDSFLADFSCPSLCPDLVVYDTLINTCSGENIDLYNYLALSNNLQYSFEYTEPITGSGASIASGQVDIGNPFGCEKGFLGVKVNGYDERQCLIEIIEVTLSVFPQTFAGIQYESDSTFCKPQLILECTEYFEISWKDNAGNEGVGDTYEGTANTSGYVTFYVYPIDSSLTNLTCAVDSFFADYRCKAECPDIIERTEKITVCANSEFNLYSELRLSNDVLYYSDNELVIDSVTILGNLFGCEVGVLDSVIEAYDENQCLVEKIKVEITVIPEFYGELHQLGDGTCEVILNLECPDLYQVTWEDTNGQSGEGIVFVPVPGTSGKVTFKVNLNIPELDVTAIEGACPNQVLAFDYECIADCPPSIAADWSIAICGEETIHIPSYFDIDSIARFTVNGIELDENQNVRFSNKSCQIETTGFEVTIYDSNACVTISHGVGVTVYPAFLGSIFYESDNSYCSPKLALECPDLYEISWTDNLGNSGEGAQYDATVGTNGVVAFYVTPIADSLFDFACPVDSFFADFNCKSICSETIERTESITVCAETLVNLYEYLDLSENAQYQFNNEHIVDGIYRVGNPYGCEMGTKDIEIKSYDTNECLVEVIKLSVRVIPAIYADVNFTADATCGVALSLECPENYEVIWEDTDGNKGTGLNYTAEENTSGTVTFTVHYLTEEIILSDIELACFSQIFTGNYDCTATCPDPELEIIDLFGCEGDEIDLIDRLEFSDNFDYRIVENINQLDLTNIKLENSTTDCSISQFSINVEVTDANDCVVSVLFVTFAVVPNISGAVVNPAEGCGLQLEVACADMYNIHWEDNLGNTGEGTNYIAKEGTQGTVLFYVNFKDSTLFDQLENKVCFANEFYGEFGCCAPEGTACDDGNAETFVDIEDGECGCVGTPCALENSGTVIDKTGLDGCSLLIEMEDGTILEPAILPEGIELVIGEKIIFSFVDLPNAGSICQAGKIVQIICLELNCPEKGTPCTDGDLATINDTEDGNCNCIGESVPTITSEIDLRFRPRLDCDSNTYCVILQGKGQQEDFFIGTSSIMVNYNSDALEFSGYTSTQFDQNTDCTGGNLTLWDDHKFDGSSVAGKFCLTMTLNGEGVSCPEITTTEWEDFGVLCFDIMDNQSAPKLTFEAKNTHFNSATNNDGSTPISLGQLGEVMMEDALVCTQAAAAITNELALKAMLQGPYRANKGLMDDQLRRKAFIPEKEPYTGIPSFNHVGNGGGEQIADGLLGVSGDDAIVDWVFVELRSENDSTMVLGTRSALIQRDGDVVDVDGVSNLQFNIPDGNYYVCIKHRNHLGVMTAAPLNFESGTPTILDLTDSDTPTFGEHALQEFQGTMVLWGGNANPDGYLILAGGGLGLPDRDMIFFDIFLSLWSADPSKPITYNSVLHGYYGSDTNMDGKVKYQGPKNDIDAIIFFNVLFHPSNTEYRLNYAIFEQIP